MDTTIDPEKGKEQIYYQLAPGYTVIDEGDEWIFSNGRDHITVQETSVESVEKVLTQLKQGKTQEALQESVPTPGSDLQDFLNRLHMEGVVKKTPAKHAGGELVLSDVSIVIAQSDHNGDSCIGTVELPFRSIQVSHGVLCKEDISQASLLLSITFGHSFRVNESHEQLAEECATPVLFVRLFQGHVLVGPLYIPGETVSFVDAYRRQKATSDDTKKETQIEAKLESQPTIPILPEHESAIQTYILSEIRSYISDSREPVTVNQVLKHEYRTLSVTHIPIIQIPDRAPSEYSQWGWSE